MAGSMYDPFWNRIKKFVEETLERFEPESLAQGTRITADQLPPGMYNPDPSGNGGHFVLTAEAVYPLLKGVNGVEVVLVDGIIEIRGSGVIPPPEDTYTYVEYNGTYVEYNGTYVVYTPPPTP